MIWIYIVLVASVMVSGLLVYLLKLKSRQALKLLLAFSAAFLIGISFLNLLPEIYEEHTIYIGLFVLLGFLLQLFLEVLTRGAEHGHEHDEEHCNQEDHVSPWLLMIGLSIHTFLEGMPIVEAFDTQLRHIFVLGIVVHKVPIAIALLTLFLHYGMNARKAFLLLFIFSLMTPLGSITSRLLQGALVQDISHYFNYVMAVVVGIFLHVSTSILFETDETHHYNYKKFLTVILGIAVAFGIALLGHGH
ncbi:MAG: ZIP family metal transporter [Bacteroidetes bacterium]|nr:ZIP family metal transporter [Bacteroidota bacterium]